MKKILCLLLSLALALSLCACGEGGKEAPAPADPAAARPQGAEAGGGETPETMTRVYAEKISPFSGGVTVSAIARLENSLLLSGSLDGEPRLGLAEISQEPGQRLRLSEARPLSLNEPEAAEEAVILALCAGGDGYFYVLTGETPALQITRDGQEVYNEDFQGDLAVLKYSQAGEFQDKLRLPAWPERDGMGNVEIRGLQVDGQGRLCLWGGGWLTLLSWEGETLSAEAPDNVLLSSASLTKEGIVLSGWDMNGVPEGSAWFLLDGEGSLSPLEGPQDEDLLTTGLFATPCQGLDGEYILNTGYDFVSYDFASGETEDLLNWNQTEEYAAGAVRAGESAFICVLPDSGSLLLAGKEEVPYVERSPVKVAVVGGGQSVENHFAVLNNQSGLYEYTVTGYTGDETGRFLTALTAGDVPDLLLFANNVNVDSDLFEDLYPYLDRDPALSRESFLPNLLEALAAGDELHQLWPGAQIQTIAARVSDVGDGSTLTVADCRRLAEESGRYLAVFPSFMYQTNYLYWIADVGLAGFVDRENASCSFDDPAFVELLAWSTEMASDEIYGGVGGSGVPMNVKTEEALLDPVFLSGPAQIHNIREQLGEDCVFTGFPNGAGGLSSYCASYGALSFAIPRAAQNKEGAWAYISGELSRERQAETYSGYADAFPANREALMDIAGAEEQFTQADRDLLEQLLSVTKFAQVSTDSTLRDLIVECGQQVLSGDKTAQEAARLLQSRANLYMAEQYS